MPPSAHRREHFFAEEAHGADRIDRQAHREHEPPHARGLSRAHLGEAFVRGATDREATAQIVEQTQLSDQRGIGVARARAVAPAQLLKCRAVLGGDAAAREIAAAGRELHKRLGAFLEPYAKLGRQLNSAVNAYNQGAGSLEARVLPQLRRIEAAGAGSEKPVPAVPGLEGTARLVIAPGEAEAA